MRFTPTSTIREVYGPAMIITDQAEADGYFAEIVEHLMTFPSSRERAEAERIARSNLGYYAGCYTDEVRERVERLFACAHPVFGSIAEKGAPTPEQAFEAGYNLAKAKAEGRQP